MHTVTKSYQDLPAAHRQPKHGGHCSLIHGHNWGFEITFACRQRDECGFVIDVGKLQLVKAFFAEFFDHTLLLNDSDPQRARLEQLHRDRLVAIKVVPDCSMEGLAEFVWVAIVGMIQSDRMPGKDRGLGVLQVVCFEDSKNSATYTPSIDETTRKNLA